MSEEMEYHKADLDAVVAAAAAITAVIPAKPAPRFLLGTSMSVEDHAKLQAHLVYHNAATTAWRTAARVALENELEKQGWPTADDDLYLDPDENRTLVNNMTLEEAREATQHPDGSFWKLRRGYEIRDAAVRAQQT